MKNTFNFTVSSDTKFTQAELLGRNKFQSFITQYNIDGEPTEDKYCVYDYKCTSNRTQYSFIVEIKNRNKYYDTWMLEMSKYRNLKNVYDNDSTVDGFYYCCFYNDDMYIFDLKKCCKSNVNRISCPKTTAVKTKNIDKDTILLDNKDAWKYSFINNKWNLIYKP